MTTAVSFDLDGTLLRYDVPFDEQFATTVSPYGEPTDDAYEAYESRLFAALERCEPAPYRRAFEAVVETVDLDAPPATLAREHCETELAATTVPDGARRVVERVAAEYPTAVLTNGDERQQRAKLERHGLADVVDAVIVSGAVGVRKPEPRIFEIASERLPADEHVHVGDSYEEDVCGARAAGFRAIHVAGESADADGDAADAVVPRVAALADPDSLSLSLPDPVAAPFQPSEG
ncbi:HAD family hydrolase [Salinilacihabitans rarus]|uniref:HAD family hydrolase n=1 Tax=Salinilacihabitans rarus TaxID=2961596 RepID=UPI0020C92B42|nr:HAD family hydrolase [Salinilacihabitans rarus]